MFEAFIIRDLLTFKSGHFFGTLATRKTSRASIFNRFALCVWLRVLHPGNVMLSTFTWWLLRFSANIVIFISKSWTFFLVTVNVDHLVTVNDTMIWFQQILIKDRHFGIYHFHCKIALLKMLKIIRNDVYGRISITYFTINQMHSHEYNTKC